MLAAMKAAKALDISGDGRIGEFEIRRLSSPFVIVAAEVALRVEAMWATAEKDGDGQIERLKCWDMIFADQELCYILGRADVTKGNAMLAAMKAAKALDISGDGRISGDELARLSSPLVIVAAEVRLRVDAMWTAAEKSSEGQIERLKCWDMIM
jgi:Ca2+-binding EF-hand superfamily protein